jgi:hypothetical protein
MKLSKLILAIVCFLSIFCFATNYDWPYAPTCQTLTGTSLTISPINLESPIKECIDITLSGNTTLNSFTNVSPPMDGWAVVVKVAQPSGGHNYTFGLTDTGGSAVPIVFSTGCLSLPTMPTETGHMLYVYLLYNTLPATPELDVLSCPNT